MNDANPTLVVENRDGAGTYEIIGIDGPDLITECTRSDGKFGTGERVRFPNELVQVTRNITVLDADGNESSLGDVEL